MLSWQWLLPKCHFRYNKIEWKQQTQEVKVWKSIKLLSIQNRQKEQCTTQKYKKKESITKKPN